MPDFEFLVQLAVISAWPAAPATPWQAPMISGAAGKKYSRVQLLTIDALLNGTERTGHPD